MIAERAADPELANVPSGKTGLITKRLKGIGRGDDVANHSGRIMLPESGRLRSSTLVVACKRPIQGSVALSFVYACDAALGKNICDNYSSTGYTVLLNSILSDQLGYGTERVSTLFCVR